MYIRLAVLMLLLFILLLGSIAFFSLRMLLFKHPIHSLRQPSIHGGTVIIAPSDSKGIGIELSRMLAATNSLHILLGVESVSQVKALQFEGIRSKGIEPITYDNEDINDAAKLVYRSKEIIRDLNRHITGLIVNLLDIPRSSKPNPENNTKLSTRNFDAAYRTYIKSMLRLIEACGSQMRESGRGGRVLILYPKSFDAGGQGVRSVVGDTIRSISRELSMQYRNLNITFAALALNIDVGKGHVYPNNFWALEEGTSCIGDRCTSVFQSNAVTAVAAVNNAMFSINLRHTDPQGKPTNIYLQALFITVFLLSILLPYCLSVLRGGRGRPPRVR